MRLSRKRFRIVKSLGGGNHEMRERLMVLVIDDSERAREKMARVLRQAGMQVVTLASPIGATRAILQNEVDVVVIDLQMPGIRGDRLAALFRGNPRLKRLGVVMVSGESEAELARLAAEVGATEVVSKRCLDELVPTVLRVAAWSVGTSAG